MKHTKLVWILSALAAMGLASCSCAQEPTPTPSSEQQTTSQGSGSASQTSQAPSTTQTQPSTTTTTQSQPSTPSSTSTSTPPVTHTHSWTKTGDGADYGIYECACGLTSYAKEMTQNVEGKAVNHNSFAYKLDNKSHETLTWEFTLTEARHVAFYVGAQCSYSDHLDRYLFNMNKTVNPVNPITGEAYPDDAGSSPDKDTEEKWRYAVTVNGEDSPILNGETMGQSGMTASNDAADPHDLYLTAFDLQAGKNTIALTQNSIGYRTLFNGMVRLVDLGEATPVPVEDSAELLIGADKVVNMELNQNAGAGVTKEYMALGVAVGENEPVRAHIWDNNVEYLLKAENLKDGAAGEADEDGNIKLAAGNYNFYIDLTDLSPENIKKRIWIAEAVTMPDSAKISLGGVETALTLDAEAPAGVKQYKLANLAIAKEDLFAFHVWEDNHEYWLHAENLMEGSAGVAAGDEWNNIKVEKTGNYNITLVASGITADAKCVMIEKIPEADYAKMVIGETEKVLALNPKAAEGTKEYMLLGFDLALNDEIAFHVMENDNEYWLHADNLKDGSAGVDAGGEYHNIKVEVAGDYNLYLDVTNISATAKCIFLEKIHHHEFTEVKSLQNVDGKVVTLSECACGEKEITIDFTDGSYYVGETKQASVKTKMDNKAVEGYDSLHLGASHMEWHINVDKAIENAEIYFDAGISNNNGNRYFFNQNKEVNPVNPVTGEEYPDQSATNADGADQSKWRYMVSVGDVIDEMTLLAPKFGGTMYEAGAGKADNDPQLTYLTNINLAAGDNIVRLHQMVIGYRATFGGKVHIRFQGDATINGTLPDEAKLVFGENDVAELAINPKAEEGHKEYMILEKELEAAKPFAIKIVENSETYWLHAENLKDGSLGADAGDENHNIKLAEDGKYNIYVDVTNISATAKCVWIAKAIAPVEFAWSTNEGGVANGKLNAGTAVTWKVNCAVAGHVTLYMTAKMSNASHSSQSFDANASNVFTFKINGTTDATFKGAGMTYGNFGLTTSDKLLAFAEFDVQAGENTILFTHVTSSYRLLFGDNLMLSYNG